MPHLRSLLPGRFVLDWDAFMAPAGELAGAAIRSDPSTWGSYARLVGAVVDAVGEKDVVLLGVCTPDELAGWPEGRWLLLDCSDEERRRRLSSRDAGEVADALRDAVAYRDLGMPSLDSTGLTPARAARALVDRLRPAT